MPLDVIHLKRKRSNEQFMIKQNNVTENFSELYNQDSTR